MIIDDLPKDKKIILFDGVCNYCNNKINYVIQHDTKDVFRFVSLQSEKGKAIIKYLGINTSIDSIVLYEPGYAYYIKSEAVFKIIKQLSSSAKLLLIFSIIPTNIKNVFYDIIAKNRYAWFGKKDSCILPTDEIKEKFL